MSACSRASLGAPRASSRAPSRAFRARVPSRRRAAPPPSARRLRRQRVRRRRLRRPISTSTASPTTSPTPTPAPPAPPRPVSVLRPAPPPTGVPAPLTGGGPLVTLTRGQLARKDVVTRTSGVRLGVVTQLWVDVDDWEVVALDVRPGNSPLDAIGGAVDHVLMSSLRQVGDVVLVHDESAVERRWSSYGLSTVVGCDVVTERGVYIGRVRDYEFDPEDGLVQRLVVDALGLPVVPEGVVSTYAVDVSEILRRVWTRVIVADGAESRVEQLTASLLQRLQLTAPPWEEDLATYADYYEQDERRREMDARARFEAAGRREDLRARERDYYESERRRRQGSRDYYEREREPARTSGIPLVRPNRPYERRDADGGVRRRAEREAAVRGLDRTGSEEEGVRVRVRVRDDGRRIRRRVRVRARGRWWKGRGGVFAAAAAARGVGTRGGAPPRVDSNQEPRRRRRRGGG